MYTCVCVCACVCVCMYACMYACMHVCVYVCMYRTLQSALSPRSPLFAPLLGAAPQRQAPRLQRRQPRRGTFLPSAPRKRDRRPRSISTTARRQGQQHQQRCPFHWRIQQADFAGAPWLRVLYFLFLRYTTRPQRHMCFDGLFLRTPSRAPYRTPSACANRAAYPDPPPVVPHPESIDAQAAYR